MAAVPHELAVFPTQACDVLLFSDADAAVLEARLPFLDTIGDDFGLGEDGFGLCGGQFWASVTAG
eukprot:3458786-Rhodomonas_salina.1